MIKKASESEVTLVLIYIFFLKILNLVQSFVECKVSLADSGSKRSSVLPYTIHFSPRLDSPIDQLTPFTARDFSEKTKNVPLHLAKDPNMGIPTDHTAPHRVFKGLQRMTVCEV
jgi:hypothetical protein